MPTDQKLHSREEVRRKNVSLKSVEYCIRVLCICNSIVLYISKSGWSITIVIVSIIIFFIFLNIMFKWLVLLLHIQQVPISYLGQETSYPDRFFVVFLTLSRKMPE
jgi:hypothetical protein